MKKILLIPIIATSLLTGCDFQEKPTVSIKEWLTDIEEDSFSYFHIKENKKDYDRFSFNDYQYKVAEIIKNNISSIRLKKTIPDVKGDGFTYTLDRQIGNYNSLYLMVYENCILLSAQGKKNDERISQYAEYSISEKDSKAMIEAVTKRFEEMDEFYHATNEKAEEETTLENYYAELSKEGNTAAVYYDEKVVNDTNLSLLNDIKAFDFTETNKEYNLGTNEKAYYGIDDNFLMEIGKMPREEFSIVHLYHYFKNPANPFYREVYSNTLRTYKVSNDKVDAFLQKAKAL